MKNIMQFGTRRLLPHRTFTTAAFALIAVVTIGSGVARALHAGSDSGSSSYRVDVTATRVDSLFDFLITIRNRSDDRVLNTVRLKSRPEEWATTQWGQMNTEGEHKTVIRVKGHADGTATVETVIDGAAANVQTIAAKSAHAVMKVAKQHEEHISLNLKDAEIHDVLRTFSKITNIEIIVDDDIHGDVSVTLTEVPWTEALDIILKTNNLRQERAGNTIYIHHR